MLRYLFLIPGVISLSAALTFAETGAPLPTQSFPYSMQAQKEKEKVIEKQYFDSRDTLGETQALVGIAGTEEPTEEGQSLRGVGRVDGVDIEYVHMPSPDDAIKPTDPHAAAAQKALADSLKQTGVVENTLNPGAYFTLDNNSPGGPDTLPEFAQREEDKRGENIKPPLPTAKEIREFSYGLGGA